jgi:putative ABC transport system substrate-binding protein
MKKVWFPLLALALLLAVAFAVRLSLQASAHAGPRLVALIQLTEVDNNTVAGFKEAMTRLGYREGIEVTYLSTGPVGNADRLEETIRGHLQHKPDLIFVSSTPATQAVKRLTEADQHPPVVFGPVNDPLAAGVVGDLRRPGGHLTGIRLPTGDDLRLQWLLRLAPGVKRIYLPYTADDKSSLASLEQARAAAAKLGVELLAQPVAVTSGGGAAAAAACPANADAVFIPRDSRIEAGIAEFVALAAKRRLPIAAPSLTQTQAGALFSYGFVHRDIGRQAAQLANQIFKGARAGDLPVEMAESRLAINLATAARIGLAIPDDLLLQAEYVIRE